MPQKQNHSVMPDYIQCLVNKSVNNYISPLILTNKKLINLYNSPENIYKTN